jgi:hypothetical protein
MILNAGSEDLDGNIYSTRVFIIKPLFQYAKFTLSVPSLRDLKLKNSKAGALQWLLSDQFFQVSSFHPRHAYIFTRIILFSKCAMIRKKLNIHPNRIL